MTDPGDPPPYPPSSAPDTDDTITRDRFTSLAHALEQLATAATRGEIMQVFLATAHKLTGADAVAVVFRGSEDCYYADGSTESERMWHAHRFPLATFLSNWAMLDQRTAVLDNIATDERIPAPLRDAPQMRSALFVPFGGERPTGAAGACWQNPGGPRSDIAVLEALARATGASLQQCDAADRLRDSEERYRALAELSPEGIVIHVGGRYVYANPAALRMFGASQPEELLGSAVVEHIVPEFQHALRRRLAMAEHGKASPAESLTINRLDNTTLDIEVTTGPFTWHGRAAAQVLMRDVSDRRRAERAIRASEQRYRALVRASSHALYRMNADLTQLYLIDQQGNHIGSHGDGSDWLQHYVLADDRDYVRSVCEQARKTGDIVELEHRIKRPDGTQGWVFSRAVPIRSEQGVITEWFGMATDITERK
ncbi:MAG TPA: PAS domain S-box protein, partial [Burkholderiaceae bacterium]